MATSVGFAAVAGTGLGLEVGLLENNLQVGLTSAFLAVPFVGIVTLTAVEQWEKAFHPSPQLDGGSGQE